MNMNPRGSADPTFDGRGTDRRHWHLDKTLNISHLLTTAVIAGSLFAYAGGMDKRVAVLEEKMQAQAMTNQQNGQEIRDLAQDVKQELRSMRELLMKIIQERRE